VISRLYSKANTRVLEVGETLPERQTDFLRCDPLESRSQLECDLLQAEITTGQVKNTVQNANLRMRAERCSLSSRTVHGSRLDAALNPNRNRQNHLKS
jgi:hypothetical protein